MGSTGPPVCTAVNDMGPTKKLAISVSKQQFRKFCLFSVITENRPLYVCTAWTVQELTVQELLYCERAVLMDVQYCSR